MSQYDKEVIQAILIADNNVESFRPFSDTDSVALLPIVNVTLLDYALEALNQSGIEEVFIYSSHFLPNVREHIKRGIASLSSWSLCMTVNVIGGEGSRCFGDAMRDLDAKGLIRGNFILMSADTIMNADLRPILEQHKKTLKHDKGAAATLIFKEASSQIRTGNEVMIAVDRQNNRLHHHQRLRIAAKENQFDVPLEVFLINSQVELYHNLTDPQIAIGSASMLMLFSDNFDFQNRDDFVRGILINEEILDTRIYVSLLPREQYARKVNNWLAYQIVSQDIMNRWAYPMVPDMGIHGLSQQYIYWKNNIYKSPEATVTKAAMRENVVVQRDSTVDAGTTLSCSVLGVKCSVGANCSLTNAYVMDHVSVGDNCVLDFCVVGAGAQIGANCELTEGTVIAPDSVIPPNTKLTKALVKAVHKKGDDYEEEDEILTELGPKAFVIDDRRPRRQTGRTSVNESDDEDWEPISLGVPKMRRLPYTYEESEYSSSDDDEDEAGSSQGGSPVQDDAHIFYTEVMDSVARNFQEKSNPDFLILEINSSRYAYNMSLPEVNYNLVKAIFNLSCLRDPPNGNILVAVNTVFKHLGKVVTNYIKTDDAMVECLRSIEDICGENEHVRDKVSQIIHYLYDKDFVNEDSILAWYEELDPKENASLCKSLAKLVDWLQQSSDEEDDDDDDEDDDDEDSDE